MGVTAKETYKPGVDVTQEISPELRKDCQLRGQLPSEGSQVQPPARYQRHAYLLI